MTEEISKVGKPASGLDDDVRKARRGSVAVVLADHTLARRLGLGLSQRDFAKKAGLGTNTVKRIEKASADPKLSAIEAVAKAFNCPVVALLAKAK